MRTDLSVLRARVENATKVLGRCWPLQSYIAANPLAGLEKLPFDQAVAQGQALYGGRGYPNAAQLRAAWEAGAIDDDHLSDRLDAHGFTESPVRLLDRMEAAAAAPAPDRSGDALLNRVMAKWLAAFVDQGQATWAMPHRQEGFYAAWRLVAPYDTTLAHRDRLRDLPERPLEALALALSDVESAQWEAILRYHLTALPGWASFIKWRSQDRHDAWQAAHPITMTGYLAARLHTARAIGQPVAPDALSDEGEGAPRNGQDRSAMAAPWLEAWEATYREELLTDLKGAASTADTAAASDRPKAQLVFCIDVRSEVIRRHLEQTGPYQTFGYAGFFGLPMQFQPYGSATRITSCPPIVDPKHRIHEVRGDHRPDAAAAHERWVALGQAWQQLIKSLKHNVAAAFGFVEASGGLFGIAMAARTLMPRWLRTQQQAWAQRIPSSDTFCDLSLDRAPLADRADGLPVGLSVEERSYYAEAAFRLMGWQQFAPVVVFTGHGSETTNNPYASSLDCGACAGHPGGPNARTLAAICNDPAVREALSARDIEIPDDTVFLAAEHTTTTDAVRLFHPPTLTEVQARIVAQLRQDLGTARARATAERAPDLQGSRAIHAEADTARRAADWAETRPEWGLAGNAAFIIAPRTLTAGLSLNGRAFLHAYNWETDARGTALETIMTGPLVVGEWINMQYYFSTVDNAVYGSGSKITQNVIGNVGIWQGNGGDLMTGLPLQSLQSDDATPYHHPLRLLAVVHAPRARVSRIMERNAQLRSLFDHEWMALAVLDPEHGNRRCTYQPGGTWAVPSATPWQDQDTKPTVAL
ncbi:MAG: DUF2309 family protein [Bacteroidetes bacterium]|jgi:uncharacterized protein YbcC (UPF0753/DUF2309 family)|nr:DUF2309 family protein [Bacteroidota bacterium]